MGIKIQLGVQYYPLDNRLVSLEKGERTSVLEMIL